MSNWHLCRSRSKSLGRNSCASFTRIALFFWTQSGPHNATSWPALDAKLSGFLAPLYSFGPIPSVFIFRYKLLRSNPSNSAVRVTLPLVSPSFFRIYSRSTATRTSARLPKRSMGRSAGRRVTFNGICRASTRTCGFKITAAEVYVAALKGSRWGAHQMFGSRSKYSSSSFVPPSPLPTCFSDSINSIRSIHLTIL